MEPTWGISNLIKPAIIVIKRVGGIRFPDEREQEVERAIESARELFHSRYGDTYGSPNSTFIDREQNKEKILRSTFPSGRRLTPSDLDLRGFDGTREASEEAASVFLDAFYNALERTSSRALDRDRSYQKATQEHSEIRKTLGTVVDKIGSISADLREIKWDLKAIKAENNFPSKIRDTLTGSNIDELSKLIKTGQLTQALEYTETQIRKIDVAIEQVDDSEMHRRHAEVLRPYRQRLLFAAATVASWQDNIEAGREFWRHACDLGTIDSEWYTHAAVTLFNIKLRDELQHLVDKMDRESSAYQKSAPLLAFLNEDWFNVDRLLVDAKGADLLLMRVQARLEIIDPQDVEAVQITADLLDQTDGDTILPIVNLDRVQLTLKLLQLIITGYTPLDYNRRPLVDNLVRRIDVALESTDANSLFRAQAIGYLGITAELLRDDELVKLCMNEVEALDESIRSSVFFLHDPTLSPEKVDGLLSGNRISTTQSAILKAELYRASGRSLEFERELYGALFSTSDKRQRYHVLRLLAQQLRQANRSEEAQSLIDSTPLRPADRWILRSENLPEGKNPLDIVGEIEAFPLDVNVIKCLAQFTRSIIISSSDSINLDHAAESVQWAARLVEILPSRSSRLLHANALYAAQHYDEVLMVSQELSSEYPEKAIDLEAGALIGLGRQNEAINLLVSACETYPDSVHFAINAAHLLLAKNQPSEATKLLEPLITAESQDRDLLVMFAMAIRFQDPVSRDHASRAFDLLAQAYDMDNDPRIAREAWEAARTSGRKAEARRFFNTMIRDTFPVTVDTAGDIIEAISSKSEDVIIQFDGRFEALAELVRKDDERLIRLEKFRAAHILAYADFFRHHRRSWELWALWTQKSKEFSSGGGMLPEHFSILADWPSVHIEYDRQYSTEDLKLFADVTAVLTLGVLGPNLAKQLLTALGTCYLSADMLNELNSELSRINSNLLGNGAGAYIKAARFLGRRSGTIVTYSEEVESVAPNDSNIGPWRVDIGVAILHNANYVTDSDDYKDWPDTLRQSRLSSAILLASLNAAGKVSVNKAQDVAHTHAHRFEGWDTVTILPLPEVIVFDEYSFLDWVETGLIDVLGDRIKIGPWTQMRISEETERHNALKLAHTRLKNTIQVIQSALDEGIVIEVESKVNGDAHGDMHGEDTSPIESMWSSAIKALQTAKSHGLRLWADDRFYTLLLRWGGPTRLGPEIREIVVSFVDWAKEMPVISTAEVFGRLSSAERLSSEVAEQTVDKLFAQGYRMAHPILLEHALRQFPVPDSVPLTSPFQKLVDSITEVPRYFSGKFGDYYANRDGHTRLLSMRLVEQFVVGVWQAEGLSDNQRCVLANAFLEAGEHVFQKASPKSINYSFERTSVLFWQGLANVLQNMPVQDETSFEPCFMALRWLGKIAASRLEQHNDITRVLEDNVLDALKYALKAIEETREEYNPRQVISASIAPAFIPLTDAGFSDVLDPLIRRTVGSLARHTDGGRITMHYHTTEDRNGLPLKISEEETERAAAEVLRRVADGDPECARYIRATDLIFSYERSIPKEWIDEGHPVDRPFFIDVRCSLFSLLWADLPDLREIIVPLLVYQLSALDPSLAYHILLIEEDLLSDETEKAQEARDKLGVELLRSGCFEFQRSFVHALRRLRHYDTVDFTRFVGWTGEKAADALVNHRSNPNVCQIGEYLVPTTHYWGRALLTNQFDDKGQILDCAKQLINDDRNTSNIENSNLLTLAEWLADRASLAENAHDPFVAAWALRTILLVISTMNQNPEVEIDGHIVRISDWATSYIETALTANEKQSSELANRMEDRSSLASAVLLLAVFACSGEKRIQDYIREENIQEIWLDHVWLLATKLQVTLVSQQGGVASAAEAAMKAVQELKLDTSDAPAFDAFDAFDPFAFGPGGDDIGIALTLTAMLKSNYRGATWWTDTIRSYVRGIAKVGSKETIIDHEEFENRLDLLAPLRLRVLARKLIDVVEMR